MIRPMSREVDDGSASWLLASRVGRQGTSYRAELAATVSRLYLLRQDLLLRGVPGPLADRVERALQVAELDARLDALTQGAVSTWNDNLRGER